MKNILAFVGFALLILNCSERTVEPNVKSLLVQQLKYSHSEENWFVPIKTATDELSAQQSNWKDNTANHSIGELVSHLTFWNEMQLRAFKGEDFSNFEIDNDSTFKIYTEKEWKNLIIKLDSVQTELERLIEKANEKELSEWASDLLTMSSHNAYHTGQIIYIRKQKGWWK
ncbi:DinB family protein [Maribacter halichondriae]|uniref:DinB family protein n=1 Tax=Maribacter halichondriae TaxID=2980554 RepID=UPI00235883FA|nr:DinB family protein [Maribacter sp. Hal144]